MKKNSYIFTRILVCCFVIIGFILAIFPGLFVTSSSISIDGQEIFFELKVPTYTAIFGGSFDTQLGLTSASNEIPGILENAQIKSILDQTYNFQIKANLFVAILLIVSVVILPIFIWKIKSRIVCSITTVIFAIATISLATSNLLFNFASTATAGELTFANGDAHLFLGYTFFVLCYGIATTIMMFHLFRLFIKKDSLKQELDSNLKD